MIPKEIIAKVRRIQIRSRHKVNDVFAGQYHSVFKGRGMEFEEVRQYEPGDDIRLTVDLSSVTEAGNYTLPASVFIGSYENVGAKGKYQVIVNVTKQD